MDDGGRIFLQPEQAIPNLKERTIILSGMIFQGNVTRESDAPDTNNG
jgi:hypothetical protein